MPHIKRGTRASQVSIVTESKGLLGFGRNWARKGPTRIGRMQSTWVQRQLMLESPGCIQTHSWDPPSVTPCAAYVSAQPGERALSIQSSHSSHCLKVHPRSAQLQAPYQRARGKCSSRSMARSHRAACGQNHALAQAVSQRPVRIARRIPIFELVARLIL